MTLHIDTKTTLAPPTLAERMLSEGLLALLVAAHLALSLI